MPPPIRAAAAAAAAALWPALAARAAALERQAPRPRREGPDGEDGRRLDQLPYCRGDPDAFHVLRDPTDLHSDFICGAYAYGQWNYIFCDEHFDEDQQLFAFEACPECGECRAEARECWHTAGAGVDNTGFSCWTGYPTASWCGWYDNEDFTASDMCCGCGGGVLREPCVDLAEGWQDANNLTCARYMFNDWCTPDGETGPFWTRSYPVTGFAVEDFAVDNVSAFDACCSCGGGVLAASIPAPAPSPAQPERCVDKVPLGEDLWWYTKGSEYGDCTFFASADRCEVYRLWIAWNHAPDEACCVCGGGHRGPADEDLCFDYTDGRLNYYQFGCEMFNLLPQLCDTGWGNDFDFTAADMCCVCGGGFAVPAALPPGAAPAPSPAPAPTTPVEPQPSDICIHNGMRWERRCREVVVVCEWETYIDDFFVSHCKLVKSVVLPDSVVTIGNRAFQGCASLTNVELGGFLTTIELEAFHATSLRSLSLPGSIQRIEASAFASSSLLTEVVFPDSLQHLGSRAFAGCPLLTKVVIGYGVKVIEPQVFRESFRLKNVTLGNETTEIGERAFAGCYMLAQVHLPPTVSSIGSRAFWKCFELAEVTMSPAVVHIGELAFYRCRSLGAMLLGASVASIGDDAFGGCESLVEIELGEAVSYLGSRAFKGCGALSRAVVGGAVEAILSETFLSCSALAEVVVGQSVASIGDFAFQHCSALEEIAIPSLVVSVGVAAFDQCLSLRTLTLGESLSLIGVDAFRDCCVKEVTVYSTVGHAGLFNCLEVTHLTVAGGTSTQALIGDCSHLVSLTFLAEGVATAAFAGCEFIASLTIGDNVSAIGVAAFKDCRGLVSVELDKRVSSVEFEAFRGCSALRSVRMGTALGLGYIAVDVFRDCPALDTAYIPSPLPKAVADIFDCSALARVAIADGVAHVDDGFLQGCASLVAVSMPESVASVGAAAFAGCDRLASVMLGGQVQTIGHSAFSGCVALPAVNLSEPLRSIGPHAFSGCASLSEIVIPASVSSVGAHAFSGCSSLQAVSIMGALESVEEFVFSGCSALGYLQLPGSVASIGPGAFADCASLAGVGMGHSVVSIGSQAFSGCSSLASVELPSSLVAVRSGTFSGCSALRHVIIPQSTVTIEDSAFSSCSSLQGVAVPDSVESFGDGVFAGCTSLSWARVTAPVLARGCASTFQGCHGLVNMTMAASSSIPANAFKGMSIVEHVEMPAGVVDVGASAFEGCSSLLSADVPEGVAHVGPRAFAGCSSLRALVLGSAVRSVGSEAFFGCSDLAAISLGPSLLFIGSGAFENCEKVESLVVPSSVVEVADRAFAGCRSLRDVVVADSVTSFGEQVFYGSGVQSAQLPQAALSRPGAVAAALGDCSFLAAVMISDAVSSVDPSAFQGCENVAKVMAPAAVIDQGMAAMFGGCSSVKEVVISRGSAAVGASAFQGCSALAKVVIPESVGAIGAAAFEGCASLRAIELPGGVVVIGDRAFADCSSLERIVFPDSVTFLGTRAFEGCSALELASVPASLVNVVAFDDCKIVSSSDGTPYYTDPGRGCVQCPGADLLFVEFVLFATAVLGLMVLLVASGWIAVTAHMKASSRGVSTALCHTLLQGFQTLQVATQDVPWPPRLAAVLEVLSFAALRVDRVQPECQGIVLPITTRTMVVLYAIPGCLAACYVILAVGMSLRHQAPHSLAGYLKLAFHAMVANAHWMMVVLLQWSWQWAGCGYPSVLAGAQERPMLLVGDQMDVRCDASEAAWVELAALSLPALFVCQVGIPALLVFLARSSRSSCVVAAYRDEWKRRWLLVNVAYTTVLVLCRMLFLSKVDEPWVKGRIFFRSCVLLLAIVVYHALLISCQPYKKKVLVAMDGALFYSILASGVTLLCFTVATPWWVGAERLTPYSGGYDGWEEPLDGRLVHSDAPLVVILEMFLIMVVVLWMAVVAWVVHQYSPLAGALPCFGRYAASGIDYDDDDGDDKANGTQEGRCDLGSFTAGAMHAIISSPGATARDFEVVFSPHVRGAQERCGTLVPEPNGAPPLLEGTRSYSVWFYDSSEQEEVDGGHLRYAGEPEYEFWHKAIGNISSLQGYSFACVWIPGVKGCTKEAATFAEWEALATSTHKGPPIEGELWNVYQGTLQWVHDSLAHSYASAQLDPSCGNCGWFDYWAVNVMRCHQDGQRLRFAFLQLPLKEDQDMFHCVQRNSFHFVGKAQNVELSWASNRMDMVVEPVSFQEELLGSDDLQVRLLGEVFMTAARAPRRNRPDMEELYARLDAFMGSQYKARVRGLQNRRVLHFALSMTLVLGILRIYAGSVEENVSLGIVAVSFGVALVLSSGLAWARRDVVFGRVQELFAEEEDIRSGGFRQAVLKHLDLEDKEEDAPEEDALLEAEGDLDNAPPDPPPEGRFSSTVAV